jgi:hypothetical protein
LPAKETEQARKWNYEPDSEDTSSVEFLILFQHLLFCPGGGQDDGYKFSLLIISSGNSKIKKKIKKSGYQH